MLTTYGPQPWLALTLGKLASLPGLRHLLQILHTESNQKMGGPESETNPLSVLLLSYSFVKVWS